MSVLELMCADGFITVNRKIAHIVGLEAAVVLGELASEHLYYQSHDPDFDGLFYSTVENLEKRTFLSAYSQRLALNKLQDQGWISVDKRGMPARRYIRINEEKIAAVVNDKSLKFLTTGDENIKPQDVKIFDLKNNINKDNRKEYIKKGISEPEVVDDCESVNRPVNRSDIKETLEFLTAIYPNSKKINIEAAARGWYDAFKDYSYLIFNMAIQFHINNNKYYPTIPEIKKEIRRAEMLVPDNQEKQSETVKSGSDHYNLDALLNDLINEE